MQIAVLPDAGRTVLQAVQDNPGSYSHSRLAWNDHRTPPPPSPSSFNSSIGGRAAVSRLKLKPTPGLCSSGPVEKTLHQEKRGASSAGEVEKLKPQSAGPPQQNSSMDLITEQYLCGQWPRELHHHHQPQRTCMTDKATQTPVFWSDDLEGLSIHKRSASWSSAEHREEIAKLCHQLRRSVLGFHRNKESPESPSLSLCSQVQTKLPPASSTSMSVTKPAVCRVSSYNDSINRELESVFLSDTCRQQERELQDGRCAPVPPHQNSDTHTQSTDAQLSISDHHCPHLFPSAADAPHGTELFTSRSECGEGCDYVNESSSPLPPLASSPKPNNSFIFKRVPPEGCEKIKVFEETFSCRSRGFPVFSCPDRNKVSFIPTGSGPFCPVRQPGSSLCPSDCRPVSQNAQPTGQLKQTGGQDVPPSHCFSSYRTQHY
ncbi:glucocorticoid-induced transcript 1 protein-like [Astyanax mexicanus]|uniref:Glucocorticoid-induced transcript 1 protein-like n=1 Tax=Astyanax mexicanus TaxID=7994 RepID=A0A8T2MQL3_ASTMX|nr:glucocorticoid-induced transcript 1 protein-like [Astyanax mexicanus]